MLVCAGDDCCAGLLEILKARGGGFDELVDGLADLPVRLPML